MTKTTKTPKQATMVAKPPKAVVTEKPAKAAKPITPVCSKCGRENKRSAGQSPDCQSAAACARRRKEGKAAA